MTDILAYSHEAADVALHGHNPYRVTGGDAIEKVNAKFHMVVDGVTFGGVTYKSDGSVIDRLVTYPAGHFLVFMPSLALGVNDVRWTTLIEALSMIGVLWLIAPPITRPLIVLPVLADPNLMLFQTTINSDYIWIGLMLGVVWGLNRNLTVAGVLYGLAASIKQQPWFIAPFLLIWIWKTTARKNERVKATARFVVFAAGAFLLVNLVFIVDAPKDWIASQFYNGTANLPVLGNGLASLTDTGIVEINKQILFYLTAFAGLMFIATYWLFFDRLKYALWLFPAVLLWLGYRSLTHYFAPWAVLMLASLLIAWNQGEMWSDEVSP